MVQDLARGTIEIKGLTKRFNNLLAVNDLSLSSNAGEVLGVLGPNGAGKTTTIRMATGQLRPDQGKVLIGGFDVWEKPLDAKECFSVVPQANNLDRDLTVTENLVFHARYQGIGKSAYRDRIPALLEMMNLQEKADEMIDTLSGGMRRKLTIARALIRRPRVLFLDEPTVGLDPAIRRELWNLISTLAEDGMTVFLTTHYMEEADKLCDRIAILRRGVIVAQGTPVELKSSLRGSTVTIVPKDLGRAIEILSSEYGKDRLRVDGPSVAVAAVDEDDLSGLLHLLEKRGIDVLDIRTDLASLEDVFITLTEEETR